MRKSVLITGASGGIGAAAAKAFALKGYDILIHYNNSQENAQKLYNLLTENGVNCETLKADLTKDSEIEALANKAIEFNIDVLINNAGACDTTLLLDETASQIDRVIAENLTGAIKLTALLTPHFISKKSGVIINVSSIWGETGGACESVYSAAKAGLIGFTKALAKELGPSGIRVNCVSPGVINTPMLNEHTEQTKMQLKENTPLLRLGEPADIANALIFLASPAADFITGEILRINGGFLT